MPSKTFMFSTISKEEGEANTEHGKESKDSFVLHHRILRLSSANSKNKSYSEYSALINFLQNCFHLPPKLPIPYQKRPPSAKTATHNHRPTTVAQLDSPLLPSKLPLLSLEVLPIHSSSPSNKNNNSKNDNTNSPNMAMVLLRKYQPNSPPPPMVKSLFDDSEAQIYRTLEDLLNEFEEVRPSPEYSQTDSVTHSNHHPLQEDYAVRAARQATARRRTQRNNNKNNNIAAVEPPAVEPPAVEPPTNKLTKPSSTNSKQRKTPSSQTNNQASPHSMSVGGGYRLTISKPEHYNKQRKTSSKQPNIRFEKQQSLSSVNKQTNLSTKPNTQYKSQPKTTKTKHRQVKSTINISIQPSDQTQQTIAIDSNPSNPDNVIDAQVTTSSQNETLVDTAPIQQAHSKDGVTQNPVMAHGRYIHVLQQSPPPSSSSPFNHTKDTEMSYFQKQFQESIDMMPEQGDDMTPEELLNDVLNFGNETEQRPGEGFATGALETAKEWLLQSRTNKDNVSADPKLPISKKEEPNISVDNSNSEGYKEKGMKEEDELRRIFQMGEQFAQGRMVSSPNADLAQDLPSISTKQNKKDIDIDELIASDKTVPKTARIIDHDHAEFEVRVAKTNSNDDDIGSHPPMDIMSGPEVYNPNVDDPETAVNWPGAPHGTRTDAVPREHLPAELREAVKNAEFAARALMNLREIEEEDATIKTMKRRRYYLKNAEIPESRVVALRECVEEAVSANLIRDPLQRMAEESRLAILLNELSTQPEERFQEIATHYKDLLLSDDFVELIRDRLRKMADRDLEAITKGEDTTELEASHALERQNMGRLTSYAELLLKEARALGAQLEAAHLEVIRSICHVAMDPKHQTEDETAIALTDAIAGMRPMLDDSFVAYIKYAIAEEEGRLARAGTLDDPEHNQWYFVLRIVQNGVHCELSRGINRYLEHIWYVLRMETKSERRMLLEKLVDVMPSMDVRPFVNVVDNIVGSLGGAVRGDEKPEDVHILGGMTNKLLQLRRDVKEILPPERIQRISRDADEWASKQRKKLMKQRENTLKRMRSGEDQMGSTGGGNGGTVMRGEVERFT